MQRILWVFIAVLFVSTPAFAQAGKKTEAKASEKTTTSSTESVEQALMDMERRWVGASLKNDTAAMESILAADWSSTSTEGKVVSRAQTLDDMKKSKWTRSEVSDMKVRMINPDVAVVTGTWVGVGTDAKGQKVDTTERWTDVFAKVAGSWKCVVSQNTTVKK